MWAALVTVVVVLAALPKLSTPVAAQTYSCRGYPSAAVTSQLKGRVEALRHIEREAADRLLGRDTRPYDWLLEQARAGEGAIAVTALLEAENALGKCRNFIQPVRRDCASGAAALVRVIDELNGGEATAATKMTYALAMAQCERSLNIVPLRTALRVFE